MHDAHQVQPHSEAVCVHAALVLDPRRSIESVVDQHRVHHVALTSLVRHLKLVEGPLDVALCDLPPADGDLNIGEARARHTPRRADEDAADVLAGHALCAVDCGADRTLRCLHVDDTAGVHAGRNLLAAPDDGELALTVATGDEAGHLGGSDMEGGDHVERAPRLVKSGRRPAARAAGREGSCSRKDAVRRSRSAPPAVGGC